MTINCNGEIIDLSSPKVMGVLNLTPDSFYDGGKYKSEKEIVEQTAIMLADGASFIDIGAYSSRPKAAHISEDEELKRLIPVINLILQEFPQILISVDTFRSQVAYEAIQAGACLINDISAGMMDDNMMQTVGQLKVPYIMMHMRGQPQNMQEHTTYDDLIKDIIFYFSERITTAQSYGIIDMIIDPGFGFSKTTAQNFELLKQMEFFKMLDKPILAGLSRKSMIYKTLNCTPNDALNGTSVLNTIALQQGASILRVHDVKEAMECIILTQQLNF